MDIKLGPKTSEKNTILTQLKNVQINVQESPTPKFFQKNALFDNTQFCYHLCSDPLKFLKNNFSFFQKTAKKKIICIKSILDIFIFVHFEKVDPSFVFDVFFVKPLL